MTNSLKIFSWKKKCFDKYCNAVRWTSSYWKSLKTQGRTYVQLFKQEFLPVLPFLKIHFCLTGPDSVQNRIRWPNWIGIRISKTTTRCRPYSCKSIYLKWFECGIGRNLWMAGEFAPEIVSCNNVPWVQKLLLYLYHSSCKLQPLSFRSQTYVSQTFRHEILPSLVPCYLFKKQIFETTSYFRSFLK